MRRQPVSLGPVTGNRRFQMWSFRVSHGVLLLRSPKGIANRANVDIRFTGVQYCKVPRHLGQIEFCVPNADELNEASSAVEKELDASQVVVIQSGKNRFIIVSAYCTIEENDLDIMDIGE